MSHQSLHTPGGSRWAGFTQSHPWLKKHTNTKQVWESGEVGGQMVSLVTEVRKKKSKGTKKKKKALSEGEQGEEEEEG